MKRFILISVLIAFFGNAFSQEIKTDTTFIVNSNKIQVVDGKNGLKIKVYEMTQDGYVSVNQVIHKIKDFLKIFIIQRKRLIAYENKTVMP